MPQIDALPPNTEGAAAPDDLVPVHNESTGDTEKFEVADLVPPSLRQIRYYTANDTWSRPAAMLANPYAFLRVMVQGGGGAGGGAGATSGSQYSCGSGGNAGVWATKKIAIGSLGSTEAVTIGAAGAGSAGAAGGNGGNSSFGSHCTANGGTGGNIETATNTAGRYTPAAPAVTTGTGDLVVPGDPGHFGTFDPSNNNVACGGHGGKSIYGSGGENSEANSGTGRAATGKGAGGGGCALTVSQSAVAGGAGTAGLIIVEEWY